MELVGGRVRSLRLAVIIRYPSQPGHPEAGRGGGTQPLFANPSPLLAARDTAPFPSRTPCVRFKEWAEASPATEASSPAVLSGQRPDPLLSRVVSLWGMHKRRLLVSRLFLLCGSLQKKHKLPDSIFQERPFKKGRMQGGQEGNLCAPLEAIFPASAFVKRTLAFVFRLEWLPLTSLLRFRISKTSQCSIPSLQRKSDLHVSITHPDAKSSERTAFSLLFHQSSFPL